MEVNETTQLNNWTEIDSSESLNNWTVTNLSGHLNESTAYHLNSTVHVFNGVISGLTILLNVLVLYALKKYRRRIPHVNYQQTMCLCVTDLIAGVGLAFFFLTYIEWIYKSSLACLLIMAAYLVAQLAVLLNLCMLSIRRWFVLRQVEKPGATYSKTPTTLLIGLPWLVSVVCYLPPFLIKFFKSGKMSIDGCFDPAVFDNRTGFSAIGIFHSSVLFLLTIFYVCSMCKLKSLENTKKACSTSRGRSEQIQQKAFTHLFAVLMAANSTTLPVLVACLLRLSDVLIDDTFIFFQVSALNSIINPIIYSARIREIRAKTKWCTNGASPQKISSITGKFPA